MARTHAGGYEYPFGPYRSERSTFVEIVVTTVTGFPHLYQLEFAKTRKPMMYGQRFNLKQLEAFLDRHKYSPVSA